MNRLKKPILFFFCAIFLLNSYVNASEPGSGKKIILRAETVTLKGYEKVRLDISTDFYASGIQFVLIYDKSLLEYSSAEIYETIINYNHTDDSVLSYNNGLRIALVGNLDAGTDGKWVSIYFDPVSGASGSADFSLSSVKAVTNSSQYIECASELCSVSVNAVLYGDVNGDREVNIKDAVRFKKYFAGLSDLVKSNSDLNGDSAIDAGDMAELIKLLVLSV